MSDTKKHDSIDMTPIAGEGPVARIFRLATKHGYVPLNYDGASWLDTSTGERLVLSYLATAHRDRVERMFGAGAAADVPSGPAVPSNDTITMNANGIVNAARSALTRIDHPETTQGPDVRDVLLSIVDMARQIQAAQGTA